MVNPRKIRKICKEFQGEINRTITDFCDCSICGLCCKDEELTVNEIDVNRISRHLKLDKKSFLERFTGYNPETKETTMNMPCSFLIENRCTIYSIRPQVCRNYPIFVLEKGIVIINEIEGCTLTTHFNEAHLDFPSKYYPDCYKETMEKPDIMGIGKKPEDEQIRNAYYDIPHISEFIRWLNSIEKE